MAQAQNCPVTKLNQPLPSDRDVIFFDFIPDGTARVGFLTNFESDDYYDLYTVPIAGGEAPDFFNSGFIDGGTINRFSGGIQFNSTGTHAVFLADATTLGVQELYTIATAPGPQMLIKLSTTPVAGGKVKSFQISADDSTVVYFADQEVDERYEVFSVPITGGVPMKLNHTLAQGGNVARYGISLDSRLLVYTAYPDDQLRSVPLTGGTNTVLNADLVTDGHVQDFKFSNDGIHIYYRATQESIYMSELYRARLDGIDMVNKINETLVFGARVEGFAETPDASRVVYVADRYIRQREILFSVRPDGTGTIQLSDAKLSDAEYQSIDNFTITPNGNRVVYQGWQDNDQIDEIFSVRVKGGQAVKLNGPLVNGGYSFVNGNTDKYLISPDSLRVVYEADQIVKNKNELFSVSIFGGKVTKLNEEFGDFQDVRDDFEISSDSKTVVYRANQNTEETRDVFSVPIKGGDNLQVNSDLVMGGNIIQFKITRDGTGVVYMGDEDIDEKRELYSTLIDCTSPPPKPTAVMATDGKFPDRVRVTFKPVAGATVYRVHRCLSAGTTCGPPVGFPKGTTFDDKNGTPGTIYFYRVKACNASNCSLFSAANTGFSKASPAKPTGIKASDGTFHDRVRISFNEVDGATVYRVFRCLTAGLTCGSPIGFPKNGTFDDKKGTAGKVYYYRVRACTPSTCGKFSSANTGFSNTAPSKPTGIRATDGSFPGKVRVTFNTVAGATVYRVFRCTSAGQTCGSPIGFPKTGVFDDRKGASGIIYYYRVRACTATDCSQFSAANTGYRGSVP